MFLGKRLKEKRKEHKLTQEELGNLVNVSKVSVCNWEKEIKKPSTSNLIALAKTLNTSIEYLIGNDKYVVSSTEKNYGILMADEEINLIRMIRKNDRLYKMLIEDPTRTIERINKSL